MPPLIMLRKQPVVMLPSHHHTTEIQVPPENLELSTWPPGRFNAYASRDPAVSWLVGSDITGGGGQA